MSRNYKQINARNPGVYWRKVEVISPEGHRSFVFQKMREQPPVEHVDPLIAEYLEWKTPRPLVAAEMPYNTELDGYLRDADYLIEADDEILGLLND